MDIVYIDIAYIDIVQIPLAGNYCLMDCASFSYFSCDNFDWDLKMQSVYCTVILSFLFTLYIRVLT